MNRTTDDHLLELDVQAAIVAGTWSGAPVVAAAIRADRLEVLPRSLTFLAEVVRRGGIAVAAGLPEPLPTPDQSELVRTWLAAAGDLLERPAAGAWTDERFARWLDAVAAVLHARRAVRVS
jgi:hypothetical protein